MWLTPEKSYTLPQLQPIFETISLQLAPDEHFFFIIEHADALTPACANSLLKVMEEPPTGYHFLLLAERQDTILPTIRSRAVISSFYTHDGIPKEHVLFFISLALNSIIPVISFKILNAQQYQNGKHRFNRSAFYLLDSHT